jgi:uncharacterized membrane protein
MTTRKLCVLVAALGCFLLAAKAASAQSPQSNLTVTYPTGFAVSPPLSQLSQPFLPTVQTIIPLRPRPLTGGGALAPTTSLTDQALQTAVGGPLELEDDGGKPRFPGLGANGSAPPDPNLAVGPNHIVQIVNTEFAVYSKGGTIFAGYPKTIGSLFSGLPGTSCTGNFGDPIVQYDKAADRWLISQLGSFSAPGAECIAVSQTNDPTGAYNLYAYSFANNLNDYPKIGVWPTSTNSAYTATYNLFANGGSFFVGAALCAYDRAAMLSGAASPVSICFTIANDGGYLPSDLDGSTLPPAGSPGVFLTFETLSSLRYYQLSPNFANPGSSTLSAPTDIAVASFSEACGGGTCIPQAGTSQQLDSLGDRPMYRLAYRNFGDHHALVFNHSVTAGSSVGVRWYELRSPLTGAFTLYQQGTFAPDSTYRWMGSAAMDQAGDIAVGYSASSSSLFPAIRYTGRTPSDALGTMRAETSLLAGTGSQTVGLSRWGDYTAMRIDPSDDCTFWYTNQYQPSNGTFNWATFVGSFKFINCGAPPAPNFSISASPASLTLPQGQQGTSTVTVTSQNGFSSAVSLTVTGCPTGASCSFSQASVTPPSNGSVTSTLTVNAGTATPNTYTLTITGAGSSLSHSTNVTLTVTAPNFSISANPTSLTLAQGQQGTSTVTVTSQNGFNSPVSLTVSGCPMSATCMVSPTSVTPPANGSNASALSITPAANTPAGTYTITVIGAGGSLSHSTTVTLVVNGGASPNFSISATSLTLTQGASGNSTVTVTSLNGFNNLVGLIVSNCPANTTCSLQPTSVTPTANSTLTVSTTAGTSTGTFTLTVTGTSGTLVHSTSVALTVNSAAAPNFSISRSPRSLTLTQGRSGTSTITVTALNGFTGTVGLTVTGCPSGATGATCSLSTSSVTPTATSTLTVSTTASTSTGTFTLTITGTSGSLIHTTRVTLTVNPNADFTISASPSLLNVNTSSSGTYNVTIGHLYGSGAVNLRVSGLPSQTSARFSPNPAGNPGSSTLTVNVGSGAASGTNAMLTIRGSNGTFSHSTTLTLHIN